MELKSPISLKLEISFWVKRLASLLDSELLLTLNLFDLLLLLFWFLASRLFDRLLVSLVIDVPLSPHLVTQDRKLLSGHLEGVDRLGHDRWWIGDNSTSGRAGIDLTVNLDVRVLLQLSICDSTNEHWIAFSLRLFAWTT